MGLFDFLKKKAPPPAPAVEQGAAQDPMKGEKPAQYGGAAVPEGHELTIYRAMPEPCVVRTRGGVVLANFGVAGDDSNVELDSILRGIGTMLDKEAPPAQLVNVNRDIRLDELFAPANPEILHFRSPLSWIFHQGSVASLSAEPRRLQAVLRCMYAVSKREGAPIQQAAYLVDPPSPGTLPFVRLVCGLGLVVKQPDDREGKLCVMAEVKRPEGPILCVMSGTPYAADVVPDRYALDMNEEQAQAASAGHESMALRLQEQELVGLVERVGSAAGKPEIVLRAPRLRQIMLDFEDSGGKGGIEPILTELLSRSASFFFMKNSHDGGIEVRTYGPAGRALPMFADLRCLEWAAQDVGRAPGSFEIATIHPRNLIAMAAGGDMGIAICTYRDRKMPVYAILPDSLVKNVANALAKS